MKIFFSIILVLFSFFTSFSQSFQKPNSDLTINLSVPPDSSIIDTVIIIGNNKTKDFIILREMSLKPGMFITKDAVEYDKMRIYSLQLFNSVEIYQYSVEPPKVTLIVEVTERWYIYPFPIIGFKDRDWKKFFYGAGIIHTNFRGKNEKIYLIGTHGYEPSLFLYYRNPQLALWKDSFIETAVGYWEGKNKSPLAKGRGENFSEIHSTAGITFGKRFGLSHNLWTSFNYEIIKVTKYKPGRLLNPWEKDAFPTISAGYKYDTRDLIDYSLYGTLLTFKASKYGLFQENIDYWRFGIDYRRFIPINPNLVLAARAFTSLSAGGEIPFYKHVYFGYSERIRGHYLKIYEGENILGSSAELRFILLEPKYYNINFIPIPEFSIWKFGIAAAIFGDAGIAWFRNESFALNKFIKGYGAGLHFLLPYSFVLRVEYGLNEVRKGELIFDITAAF